MIDRTDTDFPLLRAAANIVGSRRLAQHPDRHKVTNLAKFRQGIVYGSLSDFGLIWRRMLLDNPSLDALQLADAVEPLHPPAPVDLLAEWRSAARARMAENRDRAEQAPAVDPATNAAGLLRARAALHPDD